MPKFFFSGPLFSDDCSNITPWTDGDTGDGVSSQATFDGESTFKFDNGTSPNVARRTRALPSIPTKITITARVFNDLVGTIANNDFFHIGYTRATNQTFLARFASDGLFIFDGTTNQEAGTDQVILDEWAVWQFVCDFIAMTVDVYKNGAILATGLALRVQTTFTAGSMEIRQFGSATANQISYIDWITLE